jgi:hypothetical protein
MVAVHESPCAPTSLILTDTMLYSSSVITPKMYGILLARSTYWLVAVCLIFLKCTQLWLISKSLLIFGWSTLSSRATVSLLRCKWFSSFPTVSYCVLVCDQLSPSDSAHSLQLMWALPSVLTCYSYFKYLLKITFK